MSGPAVDAKSTNDREQTPSSGDLETPGKQTRSGGRAKAPGKAAPLSQPFGSTIAPGAVAKTQVRAQLQHPHPAGTTANKRMLRYELVVGGDYGTALTALRKGFLHKLRGFEPRLAGTKGEREERRLIAQIDSLAYPILEAAYNLNELRSSPTVSADHFAKEAGHRMALDVLQRRMRERSRAYYAFLENNEHLPARLPGSGDDPSKRNHMYAIREIAEVRFGLRLELDLSSDGGTTAVASRTRKMSGAFRRDLGKLQTRLQTRSGQAQQDLLVVRSSLVEKKRLPGANRELTALLKTCDLLRAEAVTMRARASVLASMPLAEITPFLDEYNEFKKKVRALEARSRGASEAMVRRADRAIEIAQTVGDTSRFLAETLVELTLGKVAGATFGVALGAIDAYAKGKKVLPSVIGDVVSRTTGAAIKAPIKAGTSALAKSLNLSSSVGDKIATDVQTRLVRSIAGKTAESMAKGESLEKAMSGAYDKTFTGSNLRNIAYKSIFKANLPDKIPVTAD